LARLRQRRAAQPAELVQQLVLYSAQAENTRDAMVAGVILRRLDVPPETTARALVPLLENPDQPIDGFVRSVLGGIEQRAPGRTPDFSIYRALIEEELRAGREPSPVFVRYLYNTAPGEALLTLMRAHQLRDPNEIKVILWAEHVVADELWRAHNGFAVPGQKDGAAVVELSRLAAHPAWWARLYVAEIMRQHPSLRPEAALRALQADAHPLVRAAAVASGQKKP
jgi:hypothetical protein